MLGIFSANISRANLDKHKIELKGLAARKWVTLATTTPPQVVTDMLRLKPIMAKTEVAGDPEKSWLEMTFRVTEPASLPR